MLKRRILEKLIAWKKSQNKKCVIISGARQIGKTYIARKFAQENYASFIELNFLEKPSLKNIFAGALDAESILLGITLNLRGTQIIPGNTLILLDEIQECPQAITALKFLAAAEGVDVIATGSALGMAYNHPSSYPVGSIEYLDMYSLSLEEFLLANKVEESTIDLLKGYFLRREQVPLALHTPLMELLRTYMIVGGMPEVVNAFLEKRSFEAADKVQRRIYRDYINDIARFSEPELKLKAEKCYQSIPLQLQKENHKFQYKACEKNGTARKFTTSIDWLINAHFVLPVYNVSCWSYPLKSFMKDDNFRLYPHDIGLLVAAYDFNLKQALYAEQNSEESSNNIILRTSKGGLYEALAADILQKNNHKDIYFFRNATGSMELEFLLESKDGVLPIEIKAGKKNKTTSLDRILADEDIKWGYKFASQNVGVAGKKITLPIYMLMFV